VPGLPWEHGAVGQARWTGVRLCDLLEAAGIAESAAHVHLSGADAPPPNAPAYRRSIPLARALDPTTLVASRMNGAPLSLAHGAPLRLIVPGWSGNHWVKWLAHIDLYEEPATGFFMDDTYRVHEEPVTVFPVRSIIARCDAHEIAGVAFSGAAAIAHVDIQLDGTWHRAVLHGEGGAGRWQTFRLAIDAGAGSHTAIARATDATGAVQPEHAAWNANGYHYNAWHRVTWETDQSVTP
jgi:DMSO/TMAO reductase YedYZ molybdopterin-dependent catalytic subunit